MTADDSQDKPSLIDNLSRGLSDLDPDEGLRQLVAALREHPDPVVREAAAYGLRHVELPNRRDARVIVPLLGVLRNGAEEARIRGTAAESIGFTLMNADRRRKIVRLAARVLMDALGDPSPELRFWSAYGLGAIRARQALDDLRRVATTDAAMCPGWWLVRDEAADAIAHILGQPSPERMPEGPLPFLS